MSHQKELKLLLKCIQLWSSIKSYLWTLEANFWSVPKNGCLNPELESVNLSSFQLKLKFLPCRKKRTDLKSYDFKWPPWLLVDYYLKNQPYSQALFKDQLQKLIKYIKGKFLKSLKASGNVRIDFWTALLIQWKILKRRCVRICLHIHFKIMLNSVK